MVIVAQLVTVGIFEHPIPRNDLAGSLALDCPGRLVFTPCPIKAPEDFLDVSPAKGDMAPANFIAAHIDHRGMAGSR